MNQEQKGKYCELLVLTRLVKEGMTIALPYGNQSGWDLLVENDGGWEKWQIKTAHQRKGGGSIYIDCRRSGDRKTNGGRRVANRKYRATDFDVLIGVLPDTGEMWKVPISEVMGRREITVSTNNRFKW